MKTERELRLYVRKLLAENISNFIDPNDEPEVVLLAGNSEGGYVGDPIADVEMNQMADKLGSDGLNAPTVYVSTGGAKPGNDYTSGQKEANFSTKTELA